MSRIRSRNTRPELRVRSIVHALGFRFRLNVKGLPGKPDLVLAKYKAAIFVNGCFWHQHLGCKRSFIPKTNVDYWTLKLEGNAKRDEKNIKELQGLGFRVLVIWECTLKDIPKLEEMISKFLRSPEVSC